MKFNEFNENLIDLGTPVLPISVVAEHLKVHQRTLRIYDDEKILCPGRSPKNRRLYSFNDIEKGKFIQHLTRNLGLNLAGVKIALALLEEADISPDSYTEKVNGVFAQYGISQEVQNGVNIKKCQVNL